jgi:hypothetical protein
MRRRTQERIHAKATSDYFSESVSIRSLNANQSEIASATPKNAYDTILAYPTWLTGRDVLLPRPHDWKEGSSRDSKP